MKISTVTFERAQLGWRCSLWFSVTTARQFTDEYHEVVDGGSYWWTALWRAWRQAKELARAIGARPGERKVKGWAS